MRKLLSAASVLALCASPALLSAQETENNLDQAGEAAQQSVESAGEALSETGEAIAEGAESAAEATAETARDAAQATEQAAEQTGEAIAEGAEQTEETIEGAAEATAETAEDAAQATAETAGEAGEAIEEGAEQAAETTAEGVEGAAEATADAAENVEQEVEEETAEGQTGTDDGMQTETAEGMGDDDDTMQTGLSGVAEMAAANEASDGPIDDTNAFRGALLMGNNIWAVREPIEGDWQVDLETANLGDTYENVGSIDDLLINAEGELVGVLAEVGGFLGIGDKLVVLSLDELRVTLQDGQPYFVTRIAADNLEEREAVADGMWAE